MRAFIPGARAARPTRASSRQPTLAVAHPVGSRVRPVASRRPPPPAALRESRTAVNATRPRSPPPRPSTPAPALDRAAVASMDDGETVIVGSWWDWRSWTNRGKGLVLLNVLVVLCASNWVVVKEAQAALPSPAAFTAARFVVAAIAFAPFLPRVSSSTTVIAGLELGVWSAVGYAAQAAGLMTCDASRASFLSAFTVVVVPLLNGMTGARVPLLTWLCAGAAVVGVYLLEGGSGAGATLTAASNPGVTFPLAAGDAWSLLSAVGFAIQIWRTEARAREADADQTLPLLAVTVATVAVLSTGVAAAADPPAAAALVASPDAVGSALRSLDWGPILWTGIAATDGVLLIELVALRWVTSTDAAITYSLEPVLGSMAAWFVLGERFGVTSFCGAALILGAALFSSLSNDDCVT